MTKENKGSMCRDLLAEMGEVGKIFFQEIGDFFYFPMLFK